MMRPPPRSTLFPYTTLFRSDNVNSYTVSGAAADVVTLSNGVAAASITVTAGNHIVDTPLLLATSANATTANATTLTINGNLSGSRSLIASGAGTTILNGTNAHGATLINGGTLQVGTNSTSGTLGSGDVTIAPGAALVFHRSNDLEVASQIFGSAALVTKLGAGTLTLSGANSFSTEAGSAFRLNGGTVKLANAAALGRGVMLTFNGATLDLNGNNATAGLLDGPTGAIVDTAAGPGTTTFAIEQAGDGLFGGSIANGVARALAVT